MLFSKTRDVNTGAPSITFSVDDVAPAAKPRPIHELKKAFANRSGREVLAMAEGLRLVLESPPVHQRQIYQALHGLIETVHLAFAEHRPLILSPDCIWMVIAQGFGHHINQNPEKYRGRLVKHEGKEALTALKHPWDSWADAIAQISSQIRERTDPVLHETLLCDFSTTTPAIRTASEVVLMDIYQAYFEYVFMCVCGIPRITLQGAAADWHRIRARVEVLATFDLDWWVGRLRPILDEFVRTAEGEPNLTFWQAIIKPQSVYGGNVITGWIADLFPYLNDPPRRRRNPVFDTPREDWGVPVKCGIAPKAFPSGFSQVPVKLTFPGRPHESVDLMAGFFGIAQNDSDKALYPVISWAMVKSDATANNWEELAKRFPFEPAKSQMPPGRGGPVELMQFAGRYAWIHLPLAKRQWRIVPSFRLKDGKGGNWICFAYDSDALQQKRRCRALALRLVRSDPKRLDSPLVQNVYLCDLQPGYDPSAWQPEELLRFKLGDNTREWMKTSAERRNRYEASLTQVTAARLQEGDLFTFLARLIEREGDIY